MKSSVLELGALSICPQVFGLQAGAQSRPSGVPQQAAAMRRGAARHGALLSRSVLALVALSASGVEAGAKTGPAFKALMCDACYHVMTSLGKDVGFLIETGKMWKSEDLNARIAMSCMDPNLVQGAMQESCSDMIDEYSKVIAKDVALRWDEDAEEFEEDIVPTEFCAKAGICKEGHKSINQMLSDGERKDKLMKEEKAEKERLAKKKKSKEDD